MLTADSTPSRLRERGLYAKQHRMALTVFVGIAKFKRVLIHQRTSMGRAAAMQRGFASPPPHAW
jgi:DNA invertase Pin-like site-specific DNA recombinase